MSHTRYIVWYDGREAGRKYSVLDAGTRKPVVGKDGKPLTDLSYKQASELFEELIRQQKQI